MPITTPVIVDVLASITVRGNIAHVDCRQFLGAQMLPCARAQGNIWAPKNWRQSTCAIFPRTVMLAKTSTITGVVIGMTLFAARAHAQPDPDSEAKSAAAVTAGADGNAQLTDRKSTRLNSSHGYSSE